MEEDGLLQATRGYSPLGRGFLSGEIKKFEDFEATDIRRQRPRYQGESFDKTWLW